MEATSRQVNVKRQELNGKDIFTLDEAAGFLGISIRKLRYDVKSGLVPFIRLGRLYRFRRVSLEKMLADNEVPARAAVRVVMEGKE